MDPDEDTLRNLYTKWGEYALMSGNFDLAAKCFAAAKDKARVAQLLSKSKNVRISFAFSVFSFEIQRFFF